MSFPATTPRPDTAQPEETLLLVPPESQSCGTSTPGRSRIVKRHNFAVTFPDGREGVCHYERYGPKWHQFAFTYNERESLPRQYCSDPQGGVASIEATGRKQAQAAFLAACEQERKERFTRATFHYKEPRPKVFQMSAGKAKERAGRYALCLALGQALIPVASSYATLTEACTAWETRGDCRLVIACCNRLLRRWEKPRFNPLHAHPCYGKGIEAEAIVINPKPISEAITPEETQTSTFVMPMPAPSFETEETEEADEDEDDDWGFEDDEEDEDWNEEEPDDANDVEEDE